jgi:hypothetical protein
LRLWEAENKDGGEEDDDEDEEEEDDIERLEPFHPHFKIRNILSMLPAIEC